MKLPATLIITGANGQTAVRLAKELLEQGCKLLLLAHARTERIDPLISEHPESCWLEKCDLGDYAASQKAVQSLINRSGGQPQALVHTAAQRSYDAKVFAESDPQVWNGVFSDNIKMAYHVLRVVLPLLISSHKGKAVLFGSNVTRTGLPYGSAYAAAKSALANLVRSLAWENAAANVQINMISPAPMETTLEEDYNGDYLKFRQDYFSAYKNTHPARKLVSLDDIVKVVLSLLDLDVTSISGEEIYVTGGVL